MASHRTTRQGDEVYCPVCNSRWGVDGEPPENCTPYVRRVDPPKYLTDKIRKRVPRKDCITSEQWEQLRKILDGAENGERPKSY